MPYKIAIIGATGAVGTIFIKYLEDRNFPVAGLGLFASNRSESKKIIFKGEKIPVEVLKPEKLRGYDLAFFSAGSLISREFIPPAVRNGIIVIDNSAAFRMENDVPLVVPEVNSQELKNHKGIVANPNCAVIQLVLVLKPLRQITRIKRVIVSTYQSVSGAGGKAMQELDRQTRSILNGVKAFPMEIFPRQIAFNLIPAIPQKDPFLWNGFTSEEEKIIQETKKILSDHTMKISATCVRVPVFVGHSESLFLELSDQHGLEELIEVLRKAPGVKFLPENRYITPLEVAGRDEVFVGRLRKERDFDNSFSMWIVADNLRKGAALNAIQIAERLIKDV
jgi:aspartate-semialdehyde dehydrogenase